MIRLLTFLLPPLLKFFEKKMLRNDTGTLKNPFFKDFFSII